MRFLRVSGVVFSPVALRWMGAGVAAAVGAVAGVIIVMALMAGDDGRDVEPGEPGSPTAGTGTASPTTPTPGTPGPVLTPFPTVTAATHIGVARGSTITGGYGLLFGNPGTGGADVWLLPEGAMPAGVSPGGRYFVFESELIDAWTGERTTLPLAGRTLKATFAPDDSAAVIQTDTESALVASDGALVLRFPGFSAPRTGEAMWSRGSEAVAFTRESDSGARVDVVVDGVLQPDTGSTGPTAWAHEGLRLTITGEQPAIHDFDGGTPVALARGGDLPAWAPDDSHVAVSMSVNGIPALSALDAETGNEAIRVYNREGCFTIDWFHGPALQGDDSGAIHVPSGEVIAYNPVAPDPFPAVLTGPTMRWVDPGGVEYAEVSVDTIWAFSFAWVRRDLNTGFPPVVFLGRGGQDACGGQPGPYVVARPPFTDAQVPTPTPTPDK
jgi:hypothetical protein